MKFDLKLAPLLVFLLWNFELFVLVVRTDTTEETGGLRIGIRTMKKNNTKKK